MMENSHIISLAVSFIAAFISVLWLHPKMVEIAISKGITDNPDKRKLQRKPIPVLGGVAVFFGIVIGTGCSLTFCNSCEGMVTILMLLIIMLYVGTMDDIMGLSPALRFTIEIISVIIAIFAGTGYCLNDFHGLWGVNAIPQNVAVPLTIFAIVGIINAINLIDGVDGLSSGFAIMACTIFGIYFCITQDMLMAILAASCIGALIPFFIHNVFGTRSKMFIGDGGSLVMGMVLSIFVLRAIDSRYPSPEIESAGRHLGLIPFALSVMAIPVFDTLRVMGTRMLRGHSPFAPDKRHLHHAFIDLGFSHFQTTLSILLLNFIIVAGWYLLYMAGLSQSVQLVFVVVTAITFTIGIYFLIRSVRNLKNRRANSKK